MKKTILPISLLLVCIFSMSCKKSYTCTCYSAGSNGLYTNTVSTSTIKAKSKDDAQSTCQAKSTSSYGCSISN